MYFIKNPQTRNARRFLAFNISAVGSVICILFNENSRYERTGHREYLRVMLTNFKKSVPIIRLKDFFFFLNNIFLYLAIDTEFHPSGIFKI